MMMMMTDILDINYRLYAILKGPKGYSGRSSTSSQIPGCQCKTKFEQRITTEQSVHMTCKAKCLNKWCSFNCFFTQGHSKHIWLSSLTSTPVCLLTNAICIPFVLSWCNLCGLHPVGERVHEWVCVCVSEVCRQHRLSNHESGPWLCHTGERSTSC